MDLFGPVDPCSLSRRKYAMVVVDDFSRYSWVLFLHKKKDTLTKLPELMKQLQNEKATTIVKIRSDTDTKFVNHAITEFCSEHGILHELSATRTP